MKIASFLFLGIILSISNAQTQWRSRLLLDPSPVAIGTCGIDFPLSSLLVAYNGLVLGDVSLTQRGLDGGMIEGNPVMAGLTNNRAAFLAVKIAGALLSNIALKAVWNISRATGYVLAALLVLVQGLVDLHNYRLLR